MALELTDKQALQLWNEYVENIRKSTALLTGENEVQQKKRITHLEANHEEWFKYYFPQYCYAEPAEFHKKASKRIIKNDEWYEARSWSRELAKDVRTMMEILYLMLAKKSKRFMIMTSSSWDTAEKFLRPYKGNLEANQRIIHDYGAQELPGSWSAGDFITRGGCAFLALGAGQSPRGTRLEQVRPDILIINDIDTDEDCRNKDIIEKKWRWIEDALIGTRSISKNTLIIFLGNLIAEDCCVKRSHQYADHIDIINIRDENGVSSWPQKNTEENIDRVLSKVSYASQQKEYYNNPIDEGMIFKELTYGTVPKINKDNFPFVIIYADPATSNRDKPTLRSKTVNSTKAVVIVGYHNLKFYVINCFVDNVNNSTFIDWLYAAHEQVKAITQPYVYIENNTLQNPFYEQVLMPLVFEKGKVKNDVLPISPDARQKPEKFFRIMDGPDAVEGAVFKAKEKIAFISSEGIRFQKRVRNSTKSF